MAPNVKPKVFYMARIEKVLKEKKELMHDLDEKIIVVCKVEDIEKEIENA